METFLENHSLAKLTQAEIENPNSLCKIGFKSKFCQNNK